MKYIFAVLTLLVVTACGPGYQGSFRGGTTTTQTEGGQTGTDTRTGDVVFVFGTSKGVIGMMGGNSISFSNNGGTLTADPGQSFGDQSNGSTSTVTVSSGSGSLQGDSLQVNLQETYVITQPNNNRTGTLTVSFTGTRI